MNYEKATHDMIRERDVFLSVAEHELRTPLAALQLKLEVLERAVQRDLQEPLASKTASRLHDALRQTGRLSELVERLLDVSRIAAGQLELHPGRFDLHRLVEEAADDLRDQATATETQLCVSAHGDCSGTWDRRRMKQVVANLLGNAVKYGAGRPVHAAIEDFGREVRLLVVDRGIGIAAADHHRIFDPFERAAPVEHFPGLGLGLYVARRIVEAHGGAIRVSSTLGRGSTFIVSLPKSTTPAADRSATH